MRDGWIGGWVTGHFESARARSCNALDAMPTRWSRGHYSTAGDHSDAGRIQEGGCPGTAMARWRYARQTDP